MGDRTFNRRDEVAENAVAAFVAAGKDFSSAEGSKLIKSAERATIKEAALDPAVFGALYSAMNQSTDPHLKRKLLLALT